MPKTDHIVVDVVKQVFLCENCGKEISFHETHHQFQKLRYFMDWIADILKVHSKCKTKGTP